MNRRAKSLFLPDPGWGRPAWETRVIWGQSGQRPQGAGRSLTQMGAERGNNVGRPTFGGKFVNYPHFKKKWLVYGRHTTARRSI